MKFIQVAVEEIIEQYDGKIPLHHYLKSFCKARPKLGSRDRRAIADATYTYFRLAGFVSNPEDHIWNLIVWALDDVLIVNPSLRKVTDRLEVKPLEPDFKLQENKFNLSSNVDVSIWLRSLLQQPKTFIRLTKNSEETKKRLQNSEIAFDVLSEKTLALANGVQLEKILNETDYVVQDYSSQRSLEAFKSLSTFSSKDNFQVWDTCSGAGGKMLLLKDCFPHAQIFCTDIRESILHNLKMRVRQYGYKNVTTKILNAAEAGSDFTLEQGFDVALSDVPCSGSGTWARTPEQFYIFKKETLADFTKLQLQISLNASEALKPGGFFVYITCSVFKEENEAIIAQLLHFKPDLELLHQGVLNGISDKADSMFTAVLRRKKV